MTNLASLREQKELRYAKKGLALALMSGMIWSSDGLILGKGLAEGPFGDPALWLFAPLLAAGLHDFCAACLSLAINGAQGKGREVIRTLRSKAGRACIWGALLGAPLGMGGYLMALSMAGPAYVLPITSLYPAVAALLALVFLKERVSLRAWGGLALCVIGAIAIGYTPPEGAGGGLFYLGIAFAFLAAFGWAAEGVCVTSGMDFIEPACSTPGSSSRWPCGMGARPRRAATSPACWSARFRAPAWGASHWRGLWAASRTAAGTRP